MNKGLVILVFCLLLIPFNAVDILLRSVSGPDKQPAGDVAIPAETVAQSTTQSSTGPDLASIAAKPFLEDANPVPLDPQDLPQIVDKNEPKEANPAPVDMNPADFFTIVDKTSRGIAIPIQWT